MIWTGYFARIKDYPADLKPIAVSLYQPAFVRSMRVGKIAELTPSKDLLQGYKDKTISEEEYITIFRQQLSKLNPDEYGEKLQDCILLCYEGYNKFCHRHLIAEWLRDNGYECHEYAI